MSVSRGAIERVLGCPERLAPRLEAIRGIETNRPIAWEGLVRDDECEADELFSSATALGLDLHLELVALARVLELLDAPELESGLRLSVNLSPSVVVLDAVLRILEPRASRLVVEVSELAGGPSPEVVARALEPLRHVGLLVALDHAGAGFAGLERLAMLEPDVVKVDRSIVAASTRERARLIAEVTTTAAHELGAIVVAVGVERPDQLRWARDLGCDAWQGFLVHRGLGATTVGGLLERVHRGTPPAAPVVSIDADSSLALARARFGRVGLVEPDALGVVVAGRLRVGWVRYRDLADAPASSARSGREPHALGDDGVGR